MVPFERRLLVDKDFRFGLSMRFFRSRSALVEKVKRAEDLGYDILCVPDHLGAAAPLPTLTAVAMVTSRIRLSMYVLNAGFYKPALLSRDLQALNLLSDGRLEIGLGTGYVPEEFEAAELPYPGAGQPDDVGVPGRQRQHPVAIAGDEDRRRRVMLLQVGRHVFEVVDPGPGTRVRQLGGLEFLADIAGAQPDLEAAVAE